MPTPTIAVTCAASDQGGESVAGGIYTAKLDQTEIYDGFVVPEQVTATADADGLAILNLWPNALGVNGSSYRITARNPDTGKKFFDASVVVPNNPCNLYQIIQNAPFPNVDSAQQALIDVQALVTIANQDVAATNADAQQAAADRLQTGEDRTAARDSAANALTSEQIVVAAHLDITTNWSDKLATAAVQAGIATTGGNTATTQAGISTTQAGLAATAKEQAELARNAMTIYGVAGYSDSVAYSANLAMTSATQIVNYLGKAYAPLLSALPFTTSGTFEAAKFRLIQGVAGVDLAAAGGAGMVGLIQLGAGAVLRWVRDKLRETSTPEDFGAVGDGVTDDTVALNKWATAMQTSKAEFRALPKTYKVTQAGLGVKFNGFSGKVVDFGGAIFKVLDGDPVPPAGGQSGLVFYDLTDCTFLNFTYDGNRSTRVPAEVYSHSVVIGAVQRVNFVNCKSNNAVCDGWYLAAGNDADVDTYPTDVRLFNCSGKNAARNNLSVINSVRFVDYMGSYRDAIGIPPQAGVDVEPNDAGIHGNIEARFLYTTCSGNAGYGMTFGSINDNPRCEVIGLRGSNNAHGLLRLGSSSDISVKALRAGPHSTSLRGVVDVSSSAVRTHIDDAKFHGITATGGSAACIYVHADATGTQLGRIQSRGAACPDLNIQSHTILDGYTSEGNTSPAAEVVNVIGVKAANSILRNMQIKGAAFRPFVCTAPDVTVDGFGLTDCTGQSMALVRFHTGATGGRLRNTTVIQTGGIVPTGQYCAEAFGVMSEVTNLRGIGGYTSTTVLAISRANTNGVLLSGITPDPLTATVSVSSRSVPVGHSYVTTVTMPFAFIGTEVAITADQLLLNVRAWGEVNASGGVIINFVNNTAAAIAIPAVNLRVRVVKQTTN